LQIDEETENTNSTPLIFVLCLLGIMLITTTVILAKVVNRKQTDLHQRIKDRRDTPLPVKMDNRFKRDDEIPAEQSTVQKLEPSGREEDPVDPNDIKIWFFDEQDEEEIKTAVKTNPLDDGVWTNQNSLINTESDLSGKINTNPI
jgi:hypothetical protein